MVSKAGLEKIKKSCIDSNTTNRYRRVILRKNYFDALVKEVEECWSIINSNRSQATELQRDIKFLQESISKSNIKVNQIKKKTKVR